ncbi:hypothetical protein D9M73_181600 [compost metagenome]
MRGTPRHRRGRGSARLLPCADELWRRPLQTPLSDFRGRRTPPAKGPGGALAETDQRSVAHHSQGRGQVQRQGQCALPRRTSGKHPVFHRKTCAAAGTLAAGNRAHRAQDRPVFLSTAPDPGDERRLGHLLALHPDERPVRRRPGDRRFHDGISPVAHQRHLPARLRQPLLQWHQPLRPGVCHVPRHPPHVRRAYGRRSPLVP